MNNSIRGGSLSDLVKTAREQIRHSIDLQQEVPRLPYLQGQLLKTQQVSIPLTHTANYNGLKNTGYDTRNLVLATREKLQTNKARNSLFQPTDKLRILY